MVNTNTLQRSVRSTDSNSTWPVCWQKIPKEEVIYFTQVLLIYIVVVACLVNLSLEFGTQSLWSSLLSGCLGYLLPNPTIARDKKINNVPLLPNTTEQ